MRIPALAAAAALLLLVPAGAAVAAPATPPPSGPATLATGGHACTTNVPKGQAPVDALGQTAGTPATSTPISTSPTPVEGPR